MGWKQIVSIVCLTCVVQYARAEERFPVERLQHLEQAIEHLRQGGFDEVAEHLEHVHAQHLREAQHRLQELHEAVARLTAEIEQLQRTLHNAPSNHTKADKGRVFLDSERLSVSECPVGCVNRSTPWCTEKGPYGTTGSPYTGLGTCGQGVGSQKLAYSNCRHRAVTCPDPSHFSGIVTIPVGPMFAALPWLPSPYLQARPTAPSDHLRMSAAPSTVSRLWVKNEKLTRSHQAPALTEPLRLDGPIHRPVDNRSQRSADGFLVQCMFFEVPANAPLDILQHSGAELLSGETLTNPGFAVHTLTPPGREAVTRSLAQSGKVISRPQIRTLTNQPASVSIGQAVPLIFPVSNEDAEGRLGLDMRQIGSKLDIKLSPLPQGRVHVQLVPEISRATPSGVSHLNAPVPNVTVQRVQLEFDVNLDQSFILTQRQPIDGTRTIILATIKAADLATSNRTQPLPR